MARKMKGRREEKNRNIEWLSSKHAQITIFVIIAIVIVVVVILLLMLYNQPISPGPTTKKEPNQNIAQCVNEQMEIIAGKLIENNFYPDDNYPLFKEFGYNIGAKDEIPFAKYPYLCYTDRYRARCVVQEPVIIDHLEEELSIFIEPKISACFNSLKEELEGEGYSVSLQSENEQNFSLELIPGAIRTKIQREMKISIGGSERKFESYLSYVQSPLYGLATTISEIVYQESKWCNSDYVALMGINPKIEIKKFQTGDDNKIYTVKDIQSGKLVRFFIRGCVLPTPS